MHTMCTVHICGIRHAYTSWMCAYIYSTKGWLWLLVVFVCLQIDIQCIWLAQVLFIWVSRGGDSNVLYTTCILCEEIILNTYTTHTHMYKSTKTTLKIIPRQAAASTAAYTTTYIYANVFIVYCGILEVERISLEYRTIYIIYRTALYDLLRVGT